MLLVFDDKSTRTYGTAAQKELVRLLLTFCSSPVGHLLVRLQVFDRLCFLKQMNLLIKLESFELK